jgi:hypothetical protein
MGNLNDEVTIFTKIYRFAWFILIFLLIFLDRQNIYWIITTLILLFIVSGIAVLRALESRNQWQTYTQEESLDKKIQE